ncbi:MAG: helix-turn-helix transcriptional regulator [Bacteroidales bacterium]|nr:helix-turn-helix transcriptional regulator [Bacteroidales bacterium]
MKTDNHTKIYSPILKEAYDPITPQERASFELNFSISEKIYKTLNEKGLSKRDLARLTGKKESEVSRWFAFGHNFTCKTIALIQLALGVSIIEIAH